MSLAGAVGDLARFLETGIVCPVDGLDPWEAAAILDEIVSIEAERGGRFPDWMNVKPHLLFPFLWDLIRDPRLLAPVHELLGPDLLCWQVNVTSKPPMSGTFVSWHQDGTYYGLSEPLGVTVWLALTPATPENGGMYAVPGSHRKPLSHVRTNHRDNMLPFGEEIAVPVDPADAIPLALRPGQFSIHHLLTVHGSAPDRTDRRRTDLPSGTSPARCARSATGAARQPSSPGATTIPSTPSARPSPRPTRPPSSTMIRCCEGGGSSSLRRRSTNDAAALDRWIGR